MVVETLGNLVEVVVEGIVVVVIEGSIVLVVEVGLKVVEVVLKNLSQSFLTGVSRHTYVSRNFGSVSRK